MLQISDDTMCFRQSSAAITDAPVPVSPGLESIMEGNNNPDTLPIKWQYLGLEYGTLGVFPSHSESETCGIYDPRKRLNFLHKLAAVNVKSLV